MLFWQFVLFLLFSSVSSYQQEEKNILTSSLSELSIEFEGIEGVKLTCDQVRAFVDGHNWKRFHVAQGYVPAQPAATNMKTMTWDDELGEKAARWAENGQFIHNPDRTIWSQRWKNLLGENIYMNKFWSSTSVNVVPNITDAIDTWFNEYKDYSFQPFQLGSGKPIGHYTQMVWAETNRVGCGISQKKEGNCTTTLIVCDYGPTGNYLGQLPYWPSANKGFLQCASGECIRPYGFYC